MKLRVRQLQIIHVLDAYACSLEEPMVEILAGPMSGDVDTIVESEYEIEHPSAAGTGDSQIAGMQELPTAIEPIVPTQRHE